MSIHNNVTKGSMWDTPKISYSKETGELLKTMMKESRLNNFQQRQLREAISSGKTLPTRVHPTSSRKHNINVKTPTSKVIDPRPYSQQTRDKASIESSGAYDRPQFHPSPLTKFGGFYSKEKERLSNIMAYGEDIAPTDATKAFRRGIKSQTPRIDRFDELVKEVDERKEFLQQMKDIGKGDKYQTIIDTEISQLVREMEVIDDKRNIDLKVMQTTSQ